MGSASQAGRVGAAVAASTRWQCCGMVGSRQDRFESHNSRRHCRFPPATQVQAAPVLAGWLGGRQAGKQSRSETPSAHTRAHQWSSRRVGFRRMSTIVRQNTTASSRLRLGCQGVPAGRGMGVPLSASLAPGPAPASAATTLPRSLLSDLVLPSLALLPCEPLAALAAASMCAGSMLAPQF